MLHGPKQTQQSAKRLRANMSLPEVLLWRELRKRPAALKFRRQHPAGDYVLDFFCVSAKLAVEIDGSSHDLSDRPERDAKRDGWLEGQSIAVLRIPAIEVLRELDAVVCHIIATACGNLPLRHRSAMPPPPPGED